MGRWQKRKRMGGSFVTHRSHLLGVHDGALRDQILEISGHLVGLLKVWAALGAKIGALVVEFLRSLLQCVPDHKVGAKWRELHIRRLALEHFENHDTGRPDVHLGVVLLRQHHLGCHPVTGDGVREPLMHTRICLYVSMQILLACAKSLWPVQCEV